MKKATGIVRRLDPLGRISIPAEIRRTLNIEERDAIEIFTNEDGVILRKYNPGCQICGSLEDVHSVSGMKFCMNHIQEIAKAVK
jgi:transcriptional pleiotropic regulator of transition state genes